MKFLLFFYAIIVTLRGGQMRFLEQYCLTRVINYLFRPYVRHTDRFIYIEKDYNTLSTISEPSVRSRGYRRGPLPPSPPPPPPPPPHPQTPIRGSIYAPGRSLIVPITRVRFLRRDVETMS